MNLNFYIICVAAAVLFVVPASADTTATIHGEVYGWDTFEPLENAVVEVNSTPSQSMVAKYGVYSFELEPGDYLITANYYQNSTLIYSAEETVKIKGEGNYVRDLLLLPVYSEELMDSSEVKEISENQADKENSGTIMQTVTNNSDVVNGSNTDKSNAGNASIAEASEINGSTSPTVYYLFAVLMLSLLLAGSYRLRKHRSIEKNKPENYKLEKSQPEKSQLETNKPGKSILPGEKAEHKTEKFSMPVRSTPVFSAKDDERAEPENEQGPHVELAEIRSSGEPNLGESDLRESDLGESDFEVREEEKKVESNKEGHLRSEIEPADLVQEAGENKETPSEEMSLEKPAPAPEPTKMPEPEAPVPKKNLPLPADLQEIMDIIRGQGGRITQKDLRSKLRYSEGKVSLMLADLERRELIEKFKRGRGNVVILRDEVR